MLKGKGVLHCSQEFTDTVSGCGSEDDTSDDGDNRDDPGTPKMRAYPVITGGGAKVDHEKEGAATNSTSTLMAQGAGIDDDDFEVLPPKRGSSFVRRASGHDLGFHSNASPSIAIAGGDSRYEKRITRLSQQNFAGDGSTEPEKATHAKQPFKKRATNKKQPPLPRPANGGNKRLRKV
jgi:hypothetical protein